nr:RNA-directed DNA polymerase, eukaryota [Tanacetum cinerariifolium]
MKILSLNVQGLSHKTKKEWVKELNNKHGINFLALQETKMDCISHLDVKFMWSNPNYQFVSSDSVGSSGGILCVWEESIFKNENVSMSDNFISIYGTWLPTNTKILIVAIYAPQSTVLKRILWDYISGLINRWNRETIVLGDFNEVRLVDVNSKFFHDIINKRRSQLAIRGVFVSGDWHTEPSLVKDTFLEHFSTRFKQPFSSWLKLSLPFPTRLSSDQVSDLDRNISTKEIRAAVWDYGENKSPGPDGYTFEFFRRYWNVIGPDFSSVVACFFLERIVFERLQHFFHCFDPKSSGCQISYRFSPYKSDWLRILDGPFILNEVLSWCKMKRKQALVFKVDFAKAYDSVRWDFLLDILYAFGLGSRWCTFCGIFTSNMASILVNGSPITEFPMCCGLKQGDPLAHFLFILVMKTLHISVFRAVNDGIFRGLHIQGSVTLSHLFYADDAVFIGDWLTILKSVLGATPIYNMSIYKAPLSVLHEMEMLRNIFFNGGDAQGNKITWAAWDKVLSSKNNGGLGVSSFYALNRALLLKWVWRFLSHDCLLWSQIIRAINGSRLDFHSRKFWLDVWILDMPLCARFPRIFALENDTDVSVAVKQGAPSLDASFRRPVRDGVERLQWEELVAMVHDISLSTSTVDGCAISMMTTDQMEEPKERNIELHLPYGSKHRLVDAYEVEYTSSPRQVKKDIAEKLYQLLSFSV